MYSGAMCGGSAYLAACAAERLGAPVFAVIGASAAVGGTVYIVLLRVLSVLPESCSGRG